MAIIAVFFNAARSKWACGASGVRFRTRRAKRRFAAPPGA
jgi:hypothetical protein